MTRNSTNTFGVKQILSLNGLLGMLSLAFAALILTTPVFSDPCGMVPPIYAGEGNPIKRIGLQQTYVFFNKGVESFVIRPGFQGKVDNFGMLIPFPSPPSLRKVSDSVFEQIAHAVDPPEVVVDLTPRPLMAMGKFGGGGFGGGAGGGGGLEIRRRQVKVLKEEAVGMYEVAVLEAGSPEALKKWMDKNEYKYPEGMDKVTEDYIEEGWCFVAVKTKVGAKDDANPQPGKRTAQPEMPDGSVFDGTVQALGFRFKTEELVVPMRLSAFNEGELRNVVYLLTRGGKRIESIPEEFVVRQLGGSQLIRNLTEPLPLRVIGGEARDIPERRRQAIRLQRDPVPHNGIAKQLFVSDVLATNKKGFTLDHEESAKELFRIGEHFGLRGAEFDKQIEENSKEESARLIRAAMPKLKFFTLTVIDGDFPRQVIANQNLKFDDFRMALRRNNSRNYDAKVNGPTGRPKGKLIGGTLDDYLNSLPQDPANPRRRAPRMVYSALGLMGVAMLLIKLIGRRRNKAKKSGAN